MKIRVVKAGKPAFAETRALSREYEKRLGAFTRCESVEVKAELSLDLVDRAHAKDGKVVVLDERGTCWSSEETARRIDHWRGDPRVKSLTFVIGGPYGIPAEVRTKADAVWSLSPATFPSDFAWVLCWEQIYRAFHILQGTGYHHA